MKVLTPTRPARPERSVWLPEARELARAARMIAYSLGRGAQPVDVEDDLHRVADGLAFLVRALRRVPGRTTRDAAALVGATLAAMDLGDMDPADALTEIADELESLTEAVADREGRAAA